LSSSAVTRVAFGSCHKNHKAATPPIWETIAKTPATTTCSNRLPSDDDVAGERLPTLDAWLWLGDAMYPSHRDPVTNKKRYGPASMDDIRIGLYEMKSLNATIGYKDFITGPTAPKHITGVWDDHDFGGNDMGSTMPNKKERQQIYRDFLGHTGEGKDEDNRDGMYRSTYLADGRLGILTLDTRWFREDHCIPSVAHLLPMGNAISCMTRWLTSGLLLHRYAWLWGRDKCEENSLLGEDQWRWLETELLLSGSKQQQKQLQQPEAYLILSSIQVWSTNPAMESWGQFPKEHERLWKLLQKHYSQSAAPVIVLSGDVHHGEILGQPGYLEVTSSGLTHHCGQPKLYGRLCQPILEAFHRHRHKREEYYIGLNYGIVEADWERRSITIQIKNATGDTVLQVVQAMDGIPPILPPYENLPHTWDGHLFPFFAQMFWTGVLASFIATRLFRLARFVGGKKKANSTPKNLESDSLSLHPQRTVVSSDIGRD
jgi:alkaline phosphatase D